MVYGVVVHVENPQDIPYASEVTVENTERVNRGNPRKRQIYIFMVIFLIAMIFITAVVVGVIVIVDYVR